MIFVTVGTTSFNKLIYAVDTLVRQREICEEVICQIGSGNYIPAHCKWFRWKPSIKKEFRTADLVITHGGAGTTMELLLMKKPSIIVPNPSLADQHQFEFVRHLESLNLIACCYDLEKLGYLINRMRNKGFVNTYTLPEFPHLADEITRILLQKIGENG